MSIPNDWRRLRLGDVLRNSQYGLSIASSSDGKVPMLRMGNISNGRISFSDLVYVTLNENELKSFKLDKGDIVFNRTNSHELVGKAAIFESDETVVFASYLIRLKVNPTKCFPKFLHYFFNYSKTEHFLSCIATKGVSQSNINPTNLKKFLYIDLPPLPEQKKIAEILSCWDSAIETIEKLIDAKTRFKKGLMQRVFDQEVQFSDKSKWKKKHLSEVATILVSNVDKKSKDGEQPVSLCNYMDVYNNKYITSQLDFMKATATQSEIQKFTLQEGDVIITKDSETPDDIAVPAVVAEGLNQIVCGYHLAILRTDTKILLGRFLAQFLRLNKTRYYFFTLANGATRFGLSVGAIKKAEISFPSMDEQIKITNLLESCDQEIQQLGLLIEEIKEQKKGLMQQLLTGKVRVSTSKSSTQSSQEEYALNA